MPRNQEKSGCVELAKLTAFVVENYTYRLEGEGMKFGVAAAYILAIGCCLAASTARAEENALIGRSFCGFVALKLMGE